MNTDTDTGDHRPAGQPNVLGRPGGQDARGRQQRDDRPGVDRPVQERGEREHTGHPGEQEQAAAVGRSALVDFAEMDRVELLMIDKNTDLEMFAKEVRWNELYWRLA